MPGFQVQEINIYWNHKFKPNTSERVYGGHGVQLLWEYVSLDCKELQPFLPGRLLQAYREKDPKMGESACTNR